MKKIENLQPINGAALTPQHELATTPFLDTLRVEVVASALVVLWHELELAGQPCIFHSPDHGSMYTEHHPHLLNQLVASGARRKQPRFGQITSWRQLEAPTCAQGIAATAYSGTPLRADMLREAEPGDRGITLSAPTGWLCYQFARGWSALSVYFYDPEDPNDVRRLVALPEGHEDEWFAFLALLDDLHSKIARRQRRGRIEVIGGDAELVEVITRTSFDDVVLPAATLEQVAAQRRIFDAALLRRYADLRIPRLRKVLLIGPPGTGKTTLLKAEGAYHARQGGLVFYVCAPAPNRHSTSWQQLSYALRSAAESSLPTIVLVEDFEMFVSDPQELQLVLNTLDGVATPDNPSGTLLLATSNDPEKIDPRIRDRPGRVDVLIEIGPVEDVALALRFLKRFLGSAYQEEEHAPLAEQLLGQPGSHFREVCMAGSMRALDQDHSTVSRDDLLWAHETILNGRALAAQAERFQPVSARKRGGFFGKTR